MVTGDDVVTGAAIAKQLSIPGRGDPRRRLRSAAGDRTARPDRPHRRRRPGRTRAQGAARRDAQEEGPRRRHDRRRRQRRARHQGRRHRRGHGQRHRGREERQPHDPLRRQLRDDHLRGRAGPQAVRQPQQVHPLRPARARRVRAHLPRRDPAQPRGGPAIHAAADPVDQLPGQRPVRRRARLRPGDARADEPSAPSRAASRS